MNKALVVFFMLVSGLVTFAQLKPVPIDLSKTKEAPLSAVFEEIEFIPLETSKKSLFSSIKQLLVTDALFIILDTDTDALYFFNKQGRFIKKYKNKLKSYALNFIQLDPAKNAVLIFSLNKNYNITADKVNDFLERQAGADPARYVRAAWLYLDDLHTERTGELKSFPYAFCKPVKLGKDAFAGSFIKADSKNTDTLGYQLAVFNASGDVRSFFP